MKRDRIFVVILGLVLANLVFYFSGIAVQMAFKSIGYWAALISNGIAIFGVLWLLRAYKKARKAAKLNAQKEETTDKA